MKYERLIRNSKKQEKNVSKKNNPMEVLLEYLNELSRLGAAYTIEHDNEQAIMVIVSTFSERWEINFWTDGQIGAEQFESKEFLDGEEALKKSLEFWYLDDKDEDNSKDETDSETQD